MATVLRVNRGVALCGDCLCSALSLDREVAEPALVSLANAWGFERTYWTCFRCRRATAVFRALPRQYAP